MTPAAPLRWADIIIRGALERVVIRLEPMTVEEFREFLAWSIPNYAEAHVRSGRWKPEEANARSKAEHEQLLPQGVSTPDHYLRTVRDARTGERVGEAWFNFQHQEGAAQVFVYWIGILEPHRRHGYAADVFAQIEQEARRLGAVRVALHVFGDNTGAIAFYEKQGYVPTNLVMAKSLAP